MMRLWFAIPLLAVVGCDQHRDDAQVVGTWTILPAVIAGAEARSTITPTRSYVWRLNTRTGALQLCQYQDPSVVGRKMELSCFITADDNPFPTTPAAPIN
jgi:hypothetical protein